jgi:hypothetical protein
MPATRALMGRTIAFESISETPMIRATTTAAAMMIFSRASLTRAFASALL